MVDSGLCLDQSLVSRLQDFAGHEGLAPQEALEIALGLGLEAAAGEGARRDAAIASIASTAQDLVGIASLLGPPLFAILRLLVAWAAREGFGVAEDELMAEVLGAAGAEWDLQLAERGIVTRPPEREA